MQLRVITPPEPFVTPADIAGDHAADDALVASMIAAATEEIDGPTGWLGRAIGPQVIEATGCLGIERVALPCPPIISIEEVVGIDPYGAETAAAVEDYWLDGEVLVLRCGARWARLPRYRIRYKAGFNGNSGAPEGERQTGAIPERVRQAVILSVQHMKSIGVENLYLKVDEVDGVGRQEFTLTDQASNVIERACDRLLRGLKVYRV